MFVVCVTFKIKHDQIAAFLPLMMENAKLSLEKEPECDRFDVSQGGDDGDTVFLYELYTDKAAFEHHLGLEHFKRFDAVTSDMILDKQVQTYQLIRP